ncbi:hypothetical protein NM208_g8925 [Fusarium decemcellulare]|uniref:Uncharacterized protein n=1 Tax=Fusarium decemcellulare TaxID=57161 RepID=A0ACC1S3F0_9HYPO|nr:hypothetical protein NM208_g8925 [Fusarium decemcellulare]
MFKSDERYSAWDEQGLPTKMKDGSDVPKSQLKGLKKQWDRQKKAHDDLKAKGLFKGPSRRESHFSSDVGTVNMTMEKHHDIDEAIVSQTGASSDVDAIEVDWTAEEEAALVRKIDRTVMPLLILGFFALQLDRGNIGNALTDFFLEDVGITQNQFNVGQQLLSTGIVLLEIPSNIILYRLGPSKWIGSQILAWGLVATFQAFQKGLAAFLSTRLLLGLCEAGFIPAGLYTITRWYKKEETSKRFSWYFIGNMTAAASSGLIAYGILQMRGIAGLAGWQWLFIIEGLFTILVGFIFLSLFPDSPYNPVSIFKVRLFTEEESLILTKRILLDDPSKIHVKPQITKQEYKNVFTNWRLIPHIILTIAGLAPANTMSSYSPTLVRSFGYERLKSNALVSIGSWILIVSNLTWGYLGDKLRLRGPLVTLGLLMFWAFALGDRLLIESTNGHKRFALLTCTLGFGWQWHPLNGSWMALNAGSAGERSITMAILIMSANASGIIGSQLFQQKDAPLYRTGWTVIVATASLGLVASFVANLQYFLLNGRRIARGGLKYSP